MCGHEVNCGAYDQVRRRTCLVCSCSRLCHLSYHEYRCFCYCHHRLLHSQRPLPKRVAGLGAWSRAFEVLGYASVMTNAAIICVASIQSGGLFSSLTVPQTIVACVVIEHLLLLGKVLLENQIPDVPKSVRDRVLAEAIMRPKLIRKARRDSKSHSIPVHRLQQMESSASSFDAGAGAHHSLTAPAQPIVVSAVLQIVGEAPSPASATVPALDAAVPQAHPPLHRSTPDMLPAQKLLQPLHSTSAAYRRSQQPRAVSFAIPGPEQPVAPRSARSAFASVQPDSAVLPLSRPPGTQLSTGAGYPLHALSHVRTTTGATTASELEHEIPIGGHRGMQTMAAVDLDSVASASLVSNIADSTTAALKGI